MSHSNHTWNRAAVPGAAPHNNMLGGQQNYQPDPLAVASWPDERTALDTTAVRGWANYGTNKKLAIQELMKFYGLDHRADCAILRDVAGEPELTFYRTEPPGRDWFVIKVDMVKARGRASCPYRVTQAGGCYAGHQELIQVGQINTIFDKRKGQ